VLLEIVVALKGNEVFLLISRVFGFLCAVSHACLIGLEALLLAVFEAEMNAESEILLVFKSELLFTEWIHGPFVADSFALFI